MPSDTDVPRSDLGHGGHGRDIAGIVRILDRLPQSPDPAVVFTALAGALELTLCDAAAVTVTPGQGDDDLDLAVQDVAVRATAVRACPDQPGWFTATVEVIVDAGTADEHDAFVAVVTARWREAPPSAELFVVIGLGCRQAASVVLQARLRSSLADRSARVDNLRRALDSNRTIGAAIGVLMGVRHLTYDQAQLLLAEASQRRNQKMAVLAGEILYIGSLPS